MKVIQLFGPRGEDVYHDSFVELCKKIKEREEMSLRNVAEALAVRNGLLQDGPHTSPILDHRGKPFLRIVKEDHK